MIRHHITTTHDLRNWVDAATAGWWEGTDDDVLAITEAIQQSDHPAWGADWTDFLSGLPELTEFLPVEN